MHWSLFFIFNLNIFLFNLILRNVFVSSQIIWFIHIFFCDSLILPTFPATRYPGGRWCRPNQFQCANRLCVSPSWVCDGVDDCGDRSDEVLSLCCEKNYHFYPYNILLNVLF